MINKTITMMTTLIFLISPVSPLWAEDYPSAYLGEGYRGYLSGKIQNGYYYEEFSNLVRVQEERVYKRNEIEKMVVSSYQAAEDSSNGTLAATTLRNVNAQDLNTQIAEQNQHRDQVVSVESIYTYIPYRDGRIEKFQDGQVLEVENERVVDEFGNVSIQNTYDMRYNDKRLLTSYKATLTDNLGNSTYLSWYGVKYTEDSVFIGNHKTNANKNLTEYFLEVKDSLGNVRLTHVYGSTYDGKQLRAFSQTIEDSLFGNSAFTRTNIAYAGKNPSSYHEKGTGTDGLAYTLDRSNIFYNGKDQIAGYHEESFTIYLDASIVKKTVEAKFTYLGVAHEVELDEEETQPDPLLESIITTTVENPDGSTRIETATTTHSYNGNQLIRASGHSEFNDQETDWYEYTDAYGHILNRNVDENGNATYSYVDPATLETVFVDPNQVTATLKDGDLFQGTSEIQYEILYGKPMAKQTDSRTFYYGRNINESEPNRIEASTVTNDNGLVNNLQGVLGSHEHTVITQPSIDPDNSHLQVRDIISTNTYDEKGNLTDVTASGMGSGWEYQPTQGWYGEHTSTFGEEYVVILNKPVRTGYSEDRDYKDFTEEGTQEGTQEGTE